MLGRRRGGLCSLLVVLIVALLRLVLLRLALLRLGLGLGLVLLGLLGLGLVLLVDELDIAVAVAGDVDDGQLALPLALPLPLVRLVLPAEHRPNRSITQAEFPIGRFVPAFCAGNLLHLHRGIGRALGRAVRRAPVLLHHRHRRRRLAYELAPLVELLVAPVLHHRCARPKTFTPTFKKNEFF